MKQIPIVLSALLAGFIPLLSSCDTNTPALPEAQTQAAETVPTPETALVASADSPGQTDNDQAVSEYQQGKIEVAIEGFQKAAKADPKSAEARYNLGLSFDKMGKHDEAKAAFSEAAALSPTNPAITDSAILKKHTS